MPPVIGFLAEAAAMLVLMLIGFLVAAITGLLVEIALPAAWPRLDSAVAIVIVLAIADIAGYLWAVQRLCARTTDRYRLQVGVGILRTPLVNVVAVTGALAHRQR